MCKNLSKNITQNETVDVRCQGCNRPQTVAVCKVNGVIDTRPVSQHLLLVGWTVTKSSGPEYYHCPECAITGQSPTEPRPAIEL